MIKDRARWEAFEREELARENLSYKQAIVIFDALRHEAVSLGAFTPENAFDGLEVDIKVARAIHGLQYIDRGIDSKDCPRS
jgi:hypothetical protein